MKIEDAYALSLLQPLIVGYPYLPFTAAALRPFALAHILNDIVVNERREIIEFGAGLSTVLIGRLIRQNRLEARLLSVEHSEAWAEALQEKLRKEGLGDLVRVVYAPLKATGLSECSGEWYDLGGEDLRLEGRRFDMMIVDGPPAWEKGRELARYPALPLMKAGLREKHAIYLDDANRPGEQEVLRRWEVQTGFQFKITGGTLAYHYGGDSFFTEPVHY
jgi:hypothetical protein